MRIVVIALAALAAFATSADARCRAAPGDTLAAIIAADNARDLIAVMALYTDDVVWLPPGRPAMHGAAAIRESYARMYEETRPALAVTVDHTTSNGRIASVWGRTSGLLASANGGEPSHVDDAYLAVLRCEANTWRVETLIWN